MELWEVGTQLDRAGQTELIDREVIERGDEVADHYIGHAFTAMRVI